MKIENNLCPICSNDKISILYNDITTNKNLLKCKSCEIEYLNPYPTDSELKEIYSETYAAWGSGEDSDEFSSMKKEKFRKLLNITRKYCNSGKLLDVGCGPGYLMEEANKIKFDVYGVEYGEYAANIASNKFGSDRVFNGILENSNFNNNYFDIIVMSDLLEHVLDPINLLTKANNLLKYSQNSNGGGVCCYNNS